MRDYYACTPGSQLETLYIGGTNDLMRRVDQHQQKVLDGFTRKYNISKLLYYETTTDIESAITREKQIKGWVRRKKITLIESMDPYWEDLARLWNTPAPQTLHSAQDDNSFNQQTPTDRKNAIP